EDSHSLSKYSAIFLRIFSSGSLPKPAATLSATCSGLPVPGITQVIAGWPTIHLRKYCAQLATPISAAQGGSGLPRTRPNIAPSANGLGDDGDPVLRTVGQQALPGLPFGERVVDLQEIVFLPFQLPFHFAVGGGGVVRDA